MPGLVGLVNERFGFERVDGRVADEGAVDVLRFALADDQNPRRVAFAWLEHAGPVRVLLPTAWDGDVVPVFIELPHPH